VAAPVELDRQRTPSPRIRAILINSGNANACTGARGMEDARRSTEILAKALAIQSEQVLVLSTGIIGEHLPLRTIETGIAAAVPRLGHDEGAVIAAARGMMTTDTRHKIVTRRVTCDGHEYRIFGMAKGAAMIGPHMATMLGIILTDAPLTPDDAQRALCHAVNDSFNCISVEGHMSTNDTVLLLAQGGSARPLQGKALEEFSAGLDALSIELACEIPKDGEGATHLIEVHVSGCRSRDDAHRIAKAIAESALVKTAIAGADPNWGRIVSAAGYAGVAFDPHEVELKVNGLLLYRNAMPLSFDAAQVSRCIRDEHKTRIEFQLRSGSAEVRFWTCDLTAEYVRLNADYHT
jgi:glutamate N-acetyltransferase/amino-acid N-acetyltransferase